MTKRPFSEVDAGEDVGFASLVLELGSWKACAGFSGDLAPRQIVPALHSRSADGTRPRHGLRYHSPIGSGDVLESYWDAEADTLCVEHAVSSACSIVADGLQADLREHPLMLVEPPGLSSKQRGALVGALFDAGFQAVGLAGDATCATFAVGADKALVVDVGHRGTRFTAVYEGFPLHNNSARCAFGGLHSAQNWDKVIAAQCEHRSDLEVARKPVQGEVKFLEQGDTQLSQAEGLLLGRKASSHPSFHAGRRQRATHSLMEAMAEARPDPSPTAIWQLPDGHTLSLTDSARVALGSVWFAGSDTCAAQAEHGVSVDAATTLTAPTHSFQAIIQSCINSCEHHVRPLLCSNILLKGGGTHQSGFARRLEADLRNLCPSFANAKTTKVSTDTEAPDYTSWLGASILASTPAFVPRFLTKAQWDENGLDTSQLVAYC